MASWTRRSFLRVAACSGAAGLMNATARANPLGLPIGCQVYPLRTMLEDFPAFVKMVAGIGVTRLELCSPIGYGKDLIAASLGEGNGGNAPTLDQVKEAAEEYNGIAEVAAKAG